MMRIRGIAANAVIVLLLGAVGCSSSGGSDSSPSPTAVITASSIEELCFRLQTAIAADDSDAVLEAVSAIATDDQRPTRAWSHATKLLEAYEQQDQETFNTAMDDLRSECSDLTAASSPSVQADSEVSPSASIPPFYTSCEETAAAIGRFGRELVFREQAFQLLRETGVDPEEATSSEGLAALASIRDLWLRCDLTIPPSAQEALSDSGL